MQTSYYFIKDKHEKSNRTRKRLKEWRVTMELKTKIWMTGAHQWFAYLGDEEVYLGGREVPYPLREGDTWTNESGDMFQVVEGEIRLLGRTDPPRRHW